LPLVFLRRQFAVPLTAAAPANIGQGPARAANRRQRLPIIDSAPAPGIGQIT
jgi:hypothetical protein